MSAHTNRLYLAAQRVRLQRRRALRESKTRPRNRRIVAAFIRINGQLRTFTAEDMKP